MTDFTIVPIDLGRADHCEALFVLLDEYAAGPTAAGEHLPDSIRHDLPPVLAAHPRYRGWLAFVGDQPAGLVNCFEGVSTFRAQPNMNLHDIAVSPRFQRRGIASALIAAVEAHARERGCCKLTLEVLEGNTGAIETYRRSGFQSYALDPKMGSAMFLEKKFY